MAPQTAQMRMVEFFDVFLVNQCSDAMVSVQNFRLKLVAEIGAQPGIDGYLKALLPAIQYRIGQRSS